jgi:hypothetical protein
MNPIRELFSDLNGGLSSSRLLTTTVVFAVVGTWAYVSVRTGALQALPETVVWLLGLVLTARTVQRTTESKEAAPEAKT